MIKLKKQNLDHLSKLEQTTLAKITETTTFNASTGLYETSTASASFTGNVGNFSIQGMAAINATRTDGNYLTEEAWRVISESDIAMTAKIRMDSEDYKIIYKKEVGGYFVYGMVLWG